VKACGNQSSAYSLYSSTLKIEAVCSSETSVDFKRTTRPYIPEERTVHNHGYENHRFYYSLLFQCRKHVFLRRMPSSGMWLRVVLVLTDVTEESIASIFPVEKSAREEPT
jgi:hypothetical protein